MIKLGLLCLLIFVILPLLIAQFIKIGSARDEWGSELRTPTHVRKTRR